MNIKQAVQESLNHTTGYFYFDTHTQQVVFQPTLTDNANPDLLEMVEYGLIYLGRPYAFANEAEREEDLYYLLESKGVIGSE